MTTRDEAPDDRRGPSPGLCGMCRHSRRIQAARGSIFWLCERSASDPRYPRYPALPVIRCDGYEEIDLGRA